MVQSKIDSTRTIVWHEQRNFNSCGSGIRGKGVEKEIIFEALEFAIASATKNVFLRR